MERCWVALSPGCVDFAGTTAGLLEHDLGRDRALLNCWHPDHANLDAIYELVEGRQFGDSLDGPLRLLANQ
jgi:hypothetical protein